MNNIGIILNQDNNQSYLGKFYNRNQLEFPVIRKIYEQIELNKSNVVNNNKNVNFEKNNLDSVTIDNEYVNTNKNDNDIIEVDNQVNQSADDSIIILDKSNYLSNRKNSELIIDTSFDNTSVLDTSILDTSILDNVDTSHIYTNKIGPSIIEPSIIEPSNIEPSDFVRSNKNIISNLPMVEFKYKFNNSELIFLWLSSILLIYSSELYIFKNFFS